MAEPTEQDVMVLLDNIHKMGRDQIKRVFDAARLRQETIHRQAMATVDVGQTVEFMGKHGVKLTGKVRKLKTKYVEVQVPNKPILVTAGGAPVPRPDTIWNVPAGNLKVVTP